MSKTVPTERLKLLAMRGVFLPGGKIYYKGNIEGASILEEHQMAVELLAMRKVVERRPWWAWGVLGHMRHPTYALKEEL